VNRNIEVAICGLLTAAVLSAQTIHFEDTELRTNILQTADQYAESGDWTQAIMNYYALLYQFPDDSEAVVIHWKIVEMYKRGGQMTLAESNLRQVVEKYQNSKYEIENRLRLALFLYDMNRWEESLKYAYYQPEPPFKIIVAYNLIQLGEIEIADSILVMALEQTGIPIPIGTKIHELTVAPLKFPWYKKWGGFCMSAILPGSGRIYFGEYLDGTFNVAGFGALLGGTVYAANHQPQWFFYASAATIAYYIANLYATYQSAEKYFEAYKRQRYADILKEFPLADLIPLQMLY